MSALQTSLTVPTEGSTVPTEGSIPPHRFRRFIAVFDIVSGRLLETGAASWLVSPSGLVLAGNVAPPVTDLKVVLSGSDPKARRASVAGRFVRMPLGRGRIDAWIIADAGPASPALLARVLEWLVTDTEKLHELGEASAQMADRLAQGYEQMHVLFGLARMMDGTDDAASGVQRVLDEARTGISISWMALRFGDHPRLRPEVRERFLLSGYGNAEPEKIDAACVQLLAAGSSALRIILPGDSSGVAERLGCEVAAVPVRYEGRTIAMLLAGEKTDDDLALSTFETQFLAACGDLLSVFHENMTRFADQRTLFVGTVRALTSSIDAKHRYTRGHSERVALLARTMAKRLSLSDATIENYHLAGLLHDVGKIGVPEGILSKPGKLTDEEFTAIKLHPRTGYEILKGIPHLEEVLPGVLHHHEQFGGRGYPDGLCGENIPLIARVLALADTFDAMSSTRSYRGAQSRENVLQEIRNCAGRQFDPALAPLFVELDFAPFDALFQQHAEQHALDV